MGKEDKLSFSFSSKTKPPSSSSNPKRRNPQPPLSDETAEPQFFTVFDPTAAPPSGQSGLVIPPIPNSTDFRAGSIKKMKNLQSHDPSDPAASENKFVLEANSNNQQDSSNVSYGLTLRSKQDQDRHGHEHEEDGERDLTLRRFREDMKNLPDDRGMDEFAEVPIESFAAAVLAGYGWSEGRGIGRRKTDTDTKVVQYDRRAGTQGLGFDPSTKTKTKKRPSSPNPSADTREKKRPSSSSNPSVDTREEKKRSSVRWLRSNIRVRVISKELRRGKLYLKKGEVVDVVGPTTCDVSMDGSGELVQGVDQEALETALPRPGGSVLVLYGKHKGVYGSLVERNMENETGVVRDADTHSLINVRLEQIAEYVADPAYLGY